MIDYEVSETRPNIIFYQYFKKLKYVESMGLIIFKDLDLVKVIFFSPS